MDLLTILIEAAFGLVFLAALREWWRRRDALSLDVVLVFGTLIALFVVSAVTQLVGALPTLVTGVAISALLAQPGLTLRLAAHVRPIPRVVLVAAIIGWAVTALPLAVLGSDAPRPLLLGAVAVFGVTDVTAAAYLAAAARGRAGAAATRLWVAAAATALFGVALLVAGAASTAEASGESASPIPSVIALLAAISYIGAFAPPPLLRRVLQAQTAYAGLRELLAADRGTSADVWHAFLATASGATGAAFGLVATGSPDEDLRIAAMTGSDASLIGRRVPAAIDAMTDREVPLDAFAAIDGLEDVAAVAARAGARFGQAIRLGPDPDAPTVLLFTTHQSLFGEEDRLLLASLGQQAAGLVERREAVLVQQGLTDQLSATVEALRSASQAKSDFLASMSHELRTPLNAIIGFSDLMRREAGDADANVTVPLEWVEHIRRGGIHLVELVNDVLDLSRVEAGRLELDREAVEVQGAVAESVAGLRPLADRKGLAIELSVAAGDAIDADRGRLRQILYNLLSNAIKFTPEGGRITVEGGRAENEYRLAVVDTGVGIAADEQAVVFDEFRQVGGGGQRSEGSGLGLALTRRLVEAHGGRMELESTPGVGSRFTVVLPLARHSAADDIEMAPAAHGELAASADIGPVAAYPKLAATAAAMEPATRELSPSVLVVEDDPSAVRLLHAYLEPEGYRVRIAPDGEQALLDVRTERPAAILLDVLLPGMDGWEVLRRLKADPELRSIPVVMVTVVDEKDVGLALGAVDYLVKPIDRGALLASLERLALSPTTPSRAVRILAVDDEPAALDMLSETLRPAGFDILRAEGGMAAISMARAERPDLVICDLVMPDLDGFGVVAALKADPSTAAIPIIILTGYDLSAADKRRLNGKVMRIVSKGAAAQAGLRAWLVRAGSDPSADTNRAASA
ncbi:MAG: response regulator [Chloroflexota bacterium]|nr:MAG: response regulator [Chloroflexota bacterium]